MLWRVRYDRIPFSRSKSAVTNQIRRTHRAASRWQLCARGDVAVVADIPIHKPKEIVKAVGIRAVCSAVAEMPWVQQEQRSQLTLVLAH